jgi:hypothetical protein
MMPGIQNFYAGFLTGSLRDGNIILYRSRGKIGKIGPHASAIVSTDPEVLV